MSEPIIEVQDIKHSDWPAWVTMLSLGSRVMGSVKP